MGGPRLGPLQGPEGGQALVHVAPEADGGHRRSEPIEDSPLEGVPHIGPGWPDQIHQLGDDREPLDRRRWRGTSGDRREGHPGRGAQQRSGPSEQPDGVEAGGQRGHPLGADRPVGRPPPEDPAVAGGHPDQPAGVGTQGQVDNAGCHRGRRARRRPAGGPVRRGRVDRRREVLVVAAEGVGELVGHRLAHHRRPGRNQRLDDRGRSPRRGPGRGQVRVAGPGHPTGDVDDVLDRQGRAGQRTARRALDQQPGRADERPHRRIVGFSGRDCDKVCH